MSCRPWADEEMEDFEFVNEEEFYFSLEFMTDHNHNNKTNF